MRAVAKGWGLGWTPAGSPASGGEGPWQGWAESCRVLFGHNFPLVSHCISGFLVMWVLDPTGAPSNFGCSFSQLLGSR